MDEFESKFVESFDKLAEAAHLHAKQKGFWEDDRNDGELLMLMVSELSEGLEYLRRKQQGEAFTMPNDPAGRLHYPPELSDHIPEFLGIEEELADVILRIGDYAKARKYRAGEAVIAKMAYNGGRPFKHGKAY